MNKPTAKTEAPHRFSVKALWNEYIEIKRTTPISIVDVISWFCAAASLMATLYYLYFGYR